MITVEELKSKFAVRDVALYGKCIVVPGDEFDSDWEAELDEQGYSIIETDFGDPAKPVTLVKLKSQMKADSSKEVYHPEPNALPQKRKQPVAPWLNPESRWKPEEDQLIISLWDQKHNVPEIHVELHKRFPNRTEHAVKCRVTRLIKAGKIPGRWHKGEHKERQSPRKDFGFKMKHSNEIIEFARKLASQTDPAYSSRDIAKKIEEKFGVKVSNVTISEWLTSKHAEPEPTPAPSSTPAHTPSHTPPSTLVPVINTTLTIQLSVNCNDRNAVANLLEVIEKMGLRKKEASA
jgi:hypothetical protein